MDQGTPSLPSSEHKMNEVADKSNTASEKEISTMSIGELSFALMFISLLCAWLLVSQCLS